MLLSMARKIMPLGKQAVRDCLQFVHYIFRIQYVFAKRCPAMLRQTIHNCRAHQSHMLLVGSVLGAELIDYFGYEHVHFERPKQVTS